MFDLDLTLNALRDEPVHPALAGIEALVMSGLSRHREAQVSRRGMVLAGLVAVVVATSGTLAPARRVEAVPLFGVPDAAPSHLLAD